MNAKVIPYVLLLFLFSVLGGAETPFSVTITGQQVWTVRLGFGDPESLAPMNLVPGQPTLKQTFWADITGTALDVLTLEAHLDSRLGAAFQSFVLRLDRDPWHGELGNFSVGEGEPWVYNKQMIGVRLCYQGPNMAVGGTMALPQGISESRLFRGQVGEAEVTFSYEDPELPWVSAPYRRHIEGLYFWELRAPYVEGFSEPSLALEISQGLWDLLEEYGLGYLRGVIAEASPLASGSFLVLRDGGDMFLLRTEPGQLLRQRIREKIDEYNTDLPEEEKKSYPFVEGSDLERAFLAELSDFARVEMDDEVYPFAQATRRRYLYLGERDVIEGSLELQVRLPGEEEFRPITDPALGGFSWTLFPDEGILRMDFPEEFFREGAALRASFEYRLAGNVIMLGPSVVPGSERVYLNGRLCTRGTDYTIDYETGVLVLLVPLSAEDELRVDFERPRGGLGGYTEYEQRFYGLTLSVPGMDGMEVSIFRAADAGRPRPESRTMPNTHTVAGVRFLGEMGGWDYHLSIGGAQNVFPPGQNERIALPNRINTIVQVEAPDGPYTVFGHQNGLTVYHQGAFSSHGSAQGLGGRAVNDLLGLGDRLLCATDAGLTVIRLWGEAPFDRVDSWVRLYEEDGLPGEEVLALAFGEEEVFLATERAVAAFAPSVAESPDRWQTFPLPTGAHPKQLIWAEGTLYLGTEEGLYARHGDVWDPVPGVPGPVYDLAWAEGMLYVANDLGIRVLRLEVGSGWIAYGEPVYALALGPGKTLWYGSQSGAFREGDPEPVVAGTFTALGGGPDGLWGGGVADQDFHLDLWRLDPAPHRFPPEETELEGRDLGHFRNIPAEEHTAQGLVGDLSFSRKLGDWKWSVVLGTRWPGYQEIGSTARSDSHGVGVSVTYQGKGPMTSTLGFAWDMVDLSTDPHGQLSGQLWFGWSGGPTLSLGLNPVLTWKQGGPDLKLAYRTGISWSGLLRGNLSLSGDLTGPQWYTAGRLDGTLTLGPISGLTLELRGLRPFRTSGYPGDEELRFTTSWTEGIGFLSLDASWEEVLRHRPLTGEWRRESAARVDLRFGSWSLALGQFVPRTTFRYQRTPAESRWEVQGSGQLKIGPQSWQLGVTLGQGFRPATERSDRALSLTLQWDWGGSQGVRPSLRWQRNLRWLSHPLYGEQLTDTQEAVLAIVMAAAPWRDELSLTYKGEKNSWDLTNRLSWPLGFGTLSANTSVTWKGGELGGRVAGQLRGPLAKGWDLGGEVGYTFGLHPEHPFRQGFYGELSLIASF